MRYVKNFDTPRALRRYDLQVEDNHIIIRYNRILPSEQNKEMPDEDMLISQMHIANIPAVVSSIFSVFQTKDGGIVDIYENGDKLAVIMHFDDHSQFKDLVLRDRSRRIKNGLPNQMEFVFEDEVARKILCKLVNSTGALNAF